MQQGTGSLTEGSISQRLFTFSIPILIGNVLQSLNGSVNSIWIGRFLGEAALTASSNANTVLFLMLSAAFGGSMAATILIGQYLGAKRLQDAKRVVGTATSFTAGSATLTAIAGWALCEPLLRAMQTPIEALPLAVAYMRTLFLSLPFLCLFIFTTSVLRGAGDAKTPLYFLVLAVVLDIALNPLLIFGFGPVPAFGITGSALATLLAQALGLLALLAYLYQRKNVLVLHGNELALLRLDWSIVRVLIGKGIPMALQVLVVSFSAILMITLVNRFGVHTTAAFGAAFQVWNYIQMPSFAIGMAVSSMAAQNVGAQKWDRVAQTARTGAVFSLMLTGSLVLLVEIFSRPALGIFLPADSEALEIAMHMNRIIAWSFIFFGISLVLSGVVRATGAVMIPLLVLVISLLGVRFPIAWLLLEPLQADAIWWSFPISSLVALVLMVVYYKFGAWRNVRMMQAEPA